MQNKNEFSQINNDSDQRQNGFQPYQENVKMLVNLINKNSDLPVIPLILNSFAEYYNLYTEYTTGKLGTSFISKYCYFNFHDEREFVIYEEKDIIEDYLIKNKICSINNVSEYMNSMINWKTAIFFYLVKPN